MSYELLGESFDIHGGGNDLMFPHHENEIAQSCCAHPEGGFAQVWMHNEMLQVEGKKMSKSLGNFFTVHDLLELGYPGEVIRFVFLSTHYRKPMDWTAEKAREAEKTLRKWMAYSRDFGTGQPDQQVVEAVADDLNTPKAIARLHELVANGDYEALYGSLGILGIDPPNFVEWVDMLAANVREESEGSLIGEWELKLATARQTAMETKDFAEVDRLKAALVEAGIEVRMSKQGVELVPGGGFDPAKLEEALLWE